MPYPKYHRTVLYRVKRKQFHNGSVGLSDRIANLINKGIYDSASMSPQLKEESLLLDILDHYPTAQFAYTDPLHCLLAIKDPDVLDKFGFCMEEVETAPLIIENHHALFLDRPGSIVHRSDIDFSQFNLADVCHYNTFPTRVIIPTSEAINRFSNALPHLHRPEEFATDLIISTLPSLMIKQSTPEECVQLMDYYFYEDREFITQSLSESSKQYSVDEFYTVFLDLCENIINDLSHLGAYHQDNIFPYEIDCDGRERLSGGVKVKKVSFLDYQTLKG